MASKVTLLLVGLALAASLADSAYHCNPDNRDCSCADFSYKECQAPVSNDNIHVLDLEECIFQCDLFHSFGACDWFRFDQTGGEDENCHLHGPGNEPMLDYLSSCNKRGRPTRDINEACYIDPTISGMADNFCKSESFCPGGCTSCNDDICGKIHETECTMEDEGTDNSASAGTEDGCNLLCTSLGANSNEISYLVWGEREEQCICYPVGKRFCNNIIMEWGVTLDDYFRCGYPQPDPTTPPGPGPTTPDPRCHSDAECDTNDTPGFLCDQTDGLCKPGCHQHEDCRDIEYCDCDDGAPCPGGSVGVCYPGCRDQGSSCSLVQGGDGTCQEHICTPSGTPKIGEITVVTRDCAGCDGNNEGGTFEVAVTNSIGVAGCTTPKLDKAGTTDYGAGNTATFSGDELGPNSGGCKLYEAFGVTGVTVAWSGAGSWTPETVNVNHVLQTCCPNVGGGSASSSQPLKLECSQFLC